MTSPVPYTHGSNIVAADCQETVSVATKRLIPAMLFHGERKIAITEPDAGVGTVEICHTAVVDSGPRVAENRSAPADLAGAAFPYPQPEVPCFQDIPRSRG